MEKVILIIEGGNLVRIESTDENIEFHIVDGDNIQAGDLTTHKNAYQADEIIDESVVDQAIDNHFNSYLK